MTTRQRLAQVIQSTIAAIAIVMATGVFVTCAIGFTGFLLTSCTSTQKTIAYNSLDAVAHTVDSGMQAYTKLLVQGKIDQATQIKVANAKSKYEVAFVAAVTAARGNLASPSPADVQSLADALVTIITTITGK